MPLRRYLIELGAAAAFALSLIHAASENAWPNRPVHMIVPFAAGGPTDTYARIVAEQLSTIWGQQVVIDNKGGAGSNIGNAFVAHSGPDGYTLLFGTSSLVEWRSVPLARLQPDDGPDANLTGCEVSLVAFARGKAA